MISQWVCFRVSYKGVVKVPAAAGVSPEAQPMVAGQIQLSTGCWTERLRPPLAVGHRPPSAPYHVGFSGVATHLTERCPSRRQKRVCWQARSHYLMEPNHRSDIPTPLLYISCWLETSHRSCPHPEGLHKGMTIGGGDSPGHLRRWLPLHVLRLVSLNEH